MREAIYSERPKVPDFVYELIFEAEASKDAHEQVSHDEHKDLCCNSRANDCPDFKQFEIIAKDTAKAWTDMAMPDIWSFDSPEKRDEYAEALNTEIYEVLAVEILENPDLAEYISGILKAQERANEDEEIELGLKDNAFLDCASVPDELPEGLGVAEIFNAIDTDNSGSIDTTESRNALACAKEKGWITDDQEVEFFDWWVSAAGDNEKMDIDEAKEYFERVEAV